ncbi:MAG: ABC transporter substrate-binding protein [Alphaproteobacteria bacterium]|nr:ABC transporter substrate-binding protein [Alphaproteobacteria bacterium]
MFRSRHPFIVLSLVAAAIAVASLASCDTKGPAPKITIVYTAPHPVINDIIAGFKQTVTSSYPGAVFSERHAEGRPEQYGTVVLGAISNSPTILAPITTPITKLAVEQTRGRIPIVFMGVTDPVGAGVAKSLQAPGLATGSSDLCPFSELLRIARSALPKATRLGLPYNPSDQPAVFGRSQLLAIAPSFGFTIVDQQITSASELSTSVTNLASRADAIVIAADNLMMENPSAVVSAAAAGGRPAFACDTASINAGAVAGVSVNYKQVGELAGLLAVQVLQGKAPGVLPVAVLRSGGVVVNKKAACEAHIALPPDLLTKAVEVINRDYVCKSP